MSDRYDPFGDFEDDDEEAVYGDLSRSYNDGGGDDPDDEDEDT